MKHLKNIAEGVRGSSGNVTIRLVDAVELGIKGEETKNGGCRVQCSDLVTAVEKLELKTIETAQTKPETKPTGKNGRK